MITSDDKAMKCCLTQIVVTGLLLAIGGLHTVTTVEMEIPGPLTDHTVSPTRRDFYRAFSDRWESGYTGNLTINERLSVRWESWIIIMVNQDVVFQISLFPMKRDSDKIAVFTLVKTEEASDRRQIDQTLLSTSDLARDES